MSPTHRAARALLTLLAALLAVPTYLVVTASGASAARDPGPPPTLCVNDVERQFGSLKHHPEALGWYRRNGAYDPTAGRHYQGVSRIPGEGTPRFVTTRNGNPGALEPLADAEPGEVNIVELASRDTNGERVRSNRLGPRHYTKDTPPPNEDQVILSLKFGDEDGPFNWLPYRHLGGLQMWGHIAVLGMDRPFGPNGTSPGVIQLLNLSDLSDPVSAGTFRIDHQASSIGVAPFGDGRLLILTTGDNGSPVYGYEFLRNGKPSTDLRWNVADNIQLRRLFEYDAAANDDVGWPTGKDSLQTTNLFRDCGSGELYMLGAYSLTAVGQPFPDASRDRIGLWKVDPTGEPPLSLVTKRQVWCDFDGASRMCNLAAASGYHVTPGGDLMLYATEHDNDGPLKTVRMAEFSSQDGYDQDRAYRPTAVPGGTYTGQPNAPVQVDGTASTPAFAQARVELYDEPNFKGRGLVIDAPDHYKEDYRHLSRVDDYNDEASSVRWRIPKGCEAVLFDDKDYTGPRVTLPAAQGGPQADANLKKFNDDTTSVQFYGDCDGRIVSWSWDLGDDGKVDATGPTPTITATTPGVHPLALTVCSGFGVCDKKLTTLDATPTGTLPKTTPAVTGTAGANGWYRSAVTVDLSATGQPTPTEIRYSATGADPMVEKAVGGTSASVTVDAQGETTVHFRALNTAGEEAVQTLTVKVDSVAPALTVRAPVEGGRYVSGSAVTVAVECTDATSGVAACPANGAALDTAGTGARTLTASATDAAGNTATKAVSYTLQAPPAVDAQLVYVARSDASPGPIQKSNTDGSNVVQLAASGNDPVFSPDGTKVAYTENINGARQVVVVNAADGGNKTVVTGHTTGG
ncbi:MAG TPA: PKD domain-containing protein, partial [Acidimicrobiales bacterium]|nr:PKD domain-containing protein [Acidimicrobiales bacterium]